MIFYLLLSSWTIEKLNPSSAYARDFANAVQQRPELSTTKLSIVHMEQGSWVKLGESKVIKAQFPPPYITTDMALPFFIIRGPD